MLARGTCRHLGDLGFACVTEFVPERGLRVDVIALSRSGEIWIVECKSSRADFMTDNKWQGYLPWCDRFFWSVGPDFPTDILPDGTGLITADAYDADILRDAPETRLAASRRSALTRRIARTAALRLQGHLDPGPALTPSMS